MASTPPGTDEFTDSHSPPSLSNLPVLTEEIHLDDGVIASAIAQQLSKPTEAAAVSEVPADAQDQSSAGQQSTLNAENMQQFLAHTIDDAVVTAIQHALPRFIAQIRTQVAATVIRRIREEIERSQQG